MKFKLNLQYFSEPNPSGGNPEGNTPPAQEPPGGNEPPAAEPPKTFTQEELNGIAAKEAKKAQEKLLKQLGISDFDSAKDGMKKFQEWQESQKTEAQKQEERLKELETNSSSLSDENASLKAQLAAVSSGVHADYVSDVVTLAKTLVNEETDINAAIDKVVEKYPHFKGEAQQNEPPKPKFTNGQHQNNNSGDAFTNALLGRK